ncbi:hypothetical protein RND71_032269 [Anisodus tanguticus]|uniref:Uncharacterized protein n=1 Tax=Anisodus tanguticus TaxID=243964 RepID=A0AAE1RCD2_9SOLA|nr:hypothetical protein RND71_032269 [Anisodus tanguticus]
MAKLYPIKTIGPTIPSMYLTRGYQMTKSMASVSSSQWQMSALIGHINPMLQFSKRLQSKGVKITIAPTKSFLKTMKELPTPVSIEAISDGYDDGGLDEAGSYAVYITRFKEVGLDTLSQLIQKLRNCGCHL